MVIAGLEGYIKGRTARIPPLLARIPQCMDLGVRLAGPAMKPFADHRAVLDDHAADARIRRRRVEAPLRKRERARHMDAIGGARFRNRSIWRHRLSATESGHTAVLADRYDPAAPISSSASSRRVALRLL
jgi:hypothetical protein